MTFGKLKYLKDHINYVHVKSIQCDLCPYKMLKRRRKRMEIHMLRKHLFPAPLQSTVNVASDLPTPPVTACFLPPKTRDCSRAENARDGTDMSGSR